MSKSTLERKPYKSPDRNREVLTTKILALERQLREHGEILDALLKREEERSGPVLRHAPKKAPKGPAQRSTSVSVDPITPGLSEMAAQPEENAPRERDAGVAEKPAPPTWAEAAEIEQDLFGKLKLSRHDSWVLYRLAFFPGVDLQKRRSMLCESGLTEAGVRIGEALILRDPKWLTDPQEQFLYKRYVDSAERNRLSLPSIYESL